MSTVESSSIEAAGLVAENMTPAEPDALDVCSEVLAQLLQWVEGNCEWKCLPIPVARAMALQRALREVTSVPKPALQDCRDVQQERDALASIVKRLAAADFGAGTWTSEAEAAAKEAREWLNRKASNED